MADNKLNYQQARSVRKAKFSDILLDQLAQSDRSVLGAVGKTISMKGQARIKGIKEKFDPLNIIRFMTMGSRFGPALFGKMTGRNQKDIDYFTGRTKSVVGTRNTADRLKKVGGAGDSEGINQQLAKIFSFLQNNREEDIKLKQLAKNSEEEIALEKGKRHKELIDTLQKLMKQLNSNGVVTAEKVATSQNSFMDNLLGMFGGISVLRGLASAAASLVSFISSPAVLITAVVAAAGYITYQALQKQQKNLDEAAKTGDVGKTSIEAARTLDFMNPEGALYNPNLDEDTLELTRQSLKNAGTPESIKAAEELKAEIDKKKSTSTATKVTIPEAPAGMEFDAEGNVIPAPPNKFQPKLAPVVPVNTPPAPPAGMEFDADGGLIKSPVPKKLQPVVPVPKSAPVSSLSNTNSDLNLPRPAASTDMKPIINKTVNNLSQKQERTGLRPSQISVRNDEPTFMQLIIASTRVV
jgi:hypothetical protein